MCRLRSRSSAADAPGIAWPSAYRVPSRSIRYPPRESRPPALLDSCTSYIHWMILPAPLLAQVALLARLASPYPFTVGETLRYEARLGYFPVGTAEVSVTRMVEERGNQAFEFAMAGEGGPPGWRVSYNLTSHV